MSDIVNVKGIILSSMNIGDNDNRIVILTKERGKITAIARGSRRQGNHLAGLVRPFLMADFELFERRDSYLLNGGHPIEYFEELSMDMESIHYGFYCMEIADYYGREGMNAGDMLNLLYYTFKALIKKKPSYELIKLIFEFKAIVLSGEYPNIYSCVSCHGKVEPPYKISLWGGGLVCGKCKNKSPNYYDARSISEGLIYTLQYITESKVTNLYTFDLTPVIFTEFKVFMSNLCESTFDKHFKSLDVLKNLRMLTQEVIKVE